MKIKIAIKRNSPTKELNESNPNSEYDAFFQQSDHENGMLENTDIVLDDTLESWIKACKIWPSLPYFLQQLYQGALDRSLKENIFDILCYKDINTENESNHEEEPPDYNIQIFNIENERKTEYVQTEPFQSGISALIENMLSNTNTISNKTLLDILYHPSLFSLLVSCKLEKMKKIVSYENLTTILEKNASALQKALKNPENIKNIFLCEIRIIKDLLPSPHHKLLAILCEHKDAKKKLLKDVTPELIAEKDPALMCLLLGNQDYTDKIPIETIKKVILYLSKKKYLEKLHYITLGKIIVLASKLDLDLVKKILDSLKSKATFEENIQASVAHYVAHNLPKDKISDVFVLLLETLPRNASYAKRYITSIFSQLKDATPLLEKKELLQYLEPTNIWEILKDLRFSVKIDSIPIDFLDKLGSGYAADIHKNLIKRIDALNHSTEKVDEKKKEEEKKKIIMLLKLLGKKYTKSQLTTNVLSTSIKTTWTDGWSTLKYKILERAGFWAASPLGDQWEKWKKKHVSDHYQTDPSSRSKTDTGTPKSHTYIQFFDLRKMPKDTKQMQKSDATQSPELTIEEQSVRDLWTWQ